MKLSRSFKDERGTMIPMYVLFVMIIMALLTIVLDSTQVYLQRRSLQGVADGASLAAADGVNEAALYDEGLDEQGQVELVQAQTEAAVSQYENMINQNAGSQRQVDCGVSSVEQNRVQVVCDGTAVLPVVNAISQAAGFGATVPVSTQSWADASISG